VAGGAREWRGGMAVGWRAVRKGHSCVQLR
jgi:hypothetical protein